MTYYADGTLLQRPGLLEWQKNHRDAFGVVSTLGEARRRRSWRTFGWLEPGNDYRTGACPPEFLRVLEAAADHPVNRTRGIHRCQLCPTSTHDIMAPAPSYPTTTGRLLHLGSASLEVRDANGQIWIAPTLVLHYIAEHGYLPPAELADAGPA